MERAADVVDAHHAGVFDAGGQTSLELDLFGRDGGAAGVDLQGHPAIEASLDRFPDDAHPATPQDAEQIVAGDDGGKLARGRDGRGERVGRARAAAVFSGGRNRTSKSRRAAEVPRQSAFAPRGDRARDG